MKLGWMVMAWLLLAVVTAEAQQREYLDLAVLRPNAASYSSRPVDRESLDLSVLLPPAGAVVAREECDLSVLQSPRERVTKPLVVEPEPVPTTPTPSPAKKRTGSMANGCKATQSLIDASTVPQAKEPARRPGRLGYPLRSYYWTHPGVAGREELINHLTSGQHVGQFDPDVLEQLTLPELESLHSDHHDGKLKPLQWQVEPRTDRPRLDEAAKPAKRNLQKIDRGADGMLYEWSNGTWKSQPQPDGDYGPRTASAASAPKPAPLQVAQVPLVYYYPLCPGGRCPVQVRSK